jgi:hypothetical protein
MEKLMKLWNPKTYFFEAAKDLDDLLFLYQTAHYSAIWTIS